MKTIIDLFKVARPRALAVFPAIAAVASLLLSGCNTVAVDMTELQAGLQPTQHVAMNTAYGSGSALALRSTTKVSTTPSVAAARPGDVVNGSVMIFQPTAMPGPAVARVRLSPVTVNREFNGQPYNPAHVAVGEKIPTTAPDNLSQWILVSGGYTPKGVYSQPDKTSRILTRVAPGARLRLEARFDGWLKVETAHGTGYLLADDAKQLSASNDLSFKVVKQQEG